MKIGSINRQGETSLVVGTRHGILDVAAASEHFHVQVPQVMKSFITGGIEAKRVMEKLIQRAEASDNEEFLLKDGDFTWAPVLTDPEKILCVGLNYRKHALETGSAIPTRPILFSKFNNTLSGHGSAVPKPTETSQLDYEAELAIVIGTQAHHVSEEDALKYVFGYAVANDVSARDLQAATGQWLLGKTSDKFAPIGPWIATADAVHDPNALAISCLRNGRQVQASNTADMIFSCRQIISYASRFFTLQPGDIILTGTPEGVIMGFPVQERVWMEAGDRIQTVIEGIGELDFTVIAEQEANQ